MSEICPSCREDIILPSLGDLRSTVVCSHCESEFSIADFSIHTVPSLDLAPCLTAIPIREPDPPIQPTAKLKTIPVEAMYPPSDPYDEDAHAFREGSTSETEPFEFELVPVGEQGYDDRLIIPSRGFLNFGRVVRCIIGAGWALVALQAICWWGLRFDPAGLAPHVPPEVAFVLPPELQPVVDAKAPVLLASHADEAPTQSPATDAATNEENVDAESSYVTTASASSDDNQEAVFDKAVFDKSSSQNDLSDLNEVGAAGGSAVPDYLTGATPPPRLNPESIFIGNGPRWTKTYDQPDLDAAIAATQKADTSFDREQYSNSHRALMRSAKIYYAIFCNLSERATMVKMEPDVVPSLSASRDILRNIASNEVKINMFANAARNWMEKQLGKGVATAAKVNAIREVGSLFELQVQMLDSKATLATVVTRTNPTNNPWTTFDVGDKILLMGAIVEDPEVRLPGYLGSELSVIYMTDQVIRIP